MSKWFIYQKSNMARFHGCKLSKPVTMLVVLVTAISFVVMACCCLYVLNRQAEEGRYIIYLKETFNDYFEKHKNWPLSLEIIPHNLQIEASNSDPMPYEWQMLMRVHLQAKPELIVVSHDAHRFKGQLRFNWLFGGTENIELENN